MFVATKHIFSCHPLYYPNALPMFTMYFANLEL